MQAGFADEEVAAAGILADSRWPGRLCGAWRSESGKIGTLWARAVDTSDAPDTRYLYLRGAGRTHLPPYGLSDTLGGSPARSRELILVEGIFDFHQLRARGIDNVAALGGTSTSLRLFERLHGLGIEAVVLCLDNDAAGRRATANAVENSARVARSPAVYVVDPDRLGTAKDPDAVVRSGGTEALQTLLRTRECGIRWRAGELVAGVEPDAASTERREALGRAGAWLGTLPPRLALEQEDAVRAVSQRCGYSAAAVGRAFRARFWPEVGLEL